MKTKSNALALRFDPQIEEGPHRKPYTKPTVRHERVFETMALACGKVEDTSMSCHFNRKNS